MLSKDLECRGKKKKIYLIQTHNLHDPCLQMIDLLAANAHANLLGKPVNLA